MKRVFGVSLLLALFAITAFAQLSTVSLIGTVSTTDGVLPGATVTVRDNKTNKETTVTTEGDGGFRVSNLEIGFYTVTVSANGFKNYVANDVKLEVGKDYSLPVALEVGVATETVTVTAGADIINASDGQLTSTVNNRQIAELPLLARNPLSFVTLQAGVASNPGQQSTINGVRTSATNITIEGVNAQDGFIRANATDFSPARPLVDEVEEFAVASQVSADGGFGSGQIQIPIRRGGNRFNGSVFEYNRNSRFASNSFFNNANRVPRPFRNRNEFGGRIGGRIIKDRLFFFGFYQKSIDRQSSNDLTTVLTANARQGLFTYTANANDPANGVVAGQTVTVNLLNPALATGVTAIDPLIRARFLSLTPFGNTAQAGDGRVTTGFAFNQTANSEQTNYTGRLDYTLNSSNTFKGIYRYVYQTVQRNDVDGSFNQTPLVDQPSSNPFLSLGWNSTFASNFTNELVGGFFYSTPTFNRNQASPTSFVTPSLITNPEVQFQDQGRRVRTANVQNNATYLVGDHSIRFGGQFQTTRIGSFNNGGIVPTYSIGVGPNTPQITPAQFLTTSLFPGGVPQAQRGPANALLALLGGIVNGSSQTFNVNSQTSGFVNGAGNVRTFANEIYATYVTDQWRIRPDLTVNLGIRYDLYTAVRATNGLFLEPVIPIGTDPKAALLDPNGRYQFVGGNAGETNNFYNSDKNNFGPSISVAYAPKFESGFGKFLLGSDGAVFRAGYKISYINDELVASANNAFTGNAGLTSTVGAINPATGNTALNARIGSLPTINAPAFNSNRTFVDNNGAAFGFFGTAFAVDPNLKTPRIQEFSFGIQRTFGNNAVEVRYVGTRSRDLYRAVDFNQIDIRGNGFSADFDRARSNLLINQAERNRLLGTGLTQAQVNTQLPENAAFNPALAGSQVLTVFPRLASGGLLTNPAITAPLINGNTADLAFLYQTNGLNGTVQFLPNPNIGVADLLGNFGRSDYNAAQIEFRRRFSKGFQLQANYTFSKNLTNTQGSQANGVGDTQSRFDPLLDNSNPDLENARAITDQTHKFNLNGIYELPFGKGRQFLNNGGILNTLLGGFQLSGIVQIGSGAPVTITDVRGTLNRAGRSNRQTALSNLTTTQIKELIGVFNTPNGLFFINPTALGRNADGSLQAGRSGRGADGFGTPAFSGQVFFNNTPGTTSPLQRAFINGPVTFNVDLSAAKRFAFGERYSFQIQLDAFNALNRTNFFSAQSLDINSANFGLINGTSTNQRVIQLAGRFNF